MNKIMDDAAQAVSDILETAALVHGEPVAKMADFLAQAASCLKLVGLAAHTPCGSPPHETALRMLQAEHTSMANMYLAALGLNEAGSLIAAEIALTLMKQAEAAEARARAALQRGDEDSIG